MELFYVNDTPDKLPILRNFIWQLILQHDPQERHRGRGLSYSSCKHAYLILVLYKN